MGTINQDCLKSGRKIMALNLDKDAVTSAAKAALASGLLGAKGKAAAEAMGLGTDGPKNKNMSPQNSYDEDNRRAFPILSSRAVSGDDEDSGRERENEDKKHKKKKKE